MKKWKQLLLKGVVIDKKIPECVKEIGDSAFSATCFVVENPCHRIVIYTNAFGMHRLYSRMRSCRSAS